MSTRVLALPVFVLAQAQVAEFAADFAVEQLWYPLAGAASFFAVVVGFIAWRLRAMRATPLTEMKRLGIIGDRFEIVDELNDDPERNRMSND